MHCSVSGLRVIRVRLARVGCTCSGANHALGISDKAFVLLDSFVVKGVMRIGFMPVYVLVARVCPQV